MRRRELSSPFGVLFGFYVLALVFFLVRGFLGFPARELLPAFVRPYVWSTAFVELMRYAIPLTLAGAAVSYSLLSAPPPRGRTPFHRVISSHLTGMISLTVLYTALFLGLLPRAEANLERLSSLSREAGAYLDQAESALETGDRRSALQNYERYLAIDKTNEKVQTHIGELRAGLAGESDRPTPEGLPESGPLPGDQSEGLDTGELVGRAERLLAEGDYFTSYYYADLAARIDPRRTEARRLAARARRQIDRTDLKDLHEPEAAVFEKKREGFRLFSNEQYVKSYGLFYELNRQEPEDSEVDKYLELSRTRLDGQAFFLDEARAADSMPGPAGILFHNPRGGDFREIVYLGKMAVTPEGAYFADIEVVGFGSEGLSYHYGADYGKLYEGQINLRGLERRRPETESRPRVYRGTMPEGAGEAPHMLALKPDPALLRTLTAERGSLDAMGFPALWNVREQIGAFGHLEAPVGREILVRLLHPFSFVVLALAGMSAGWRFRADHSSRPRWPAYLLLPAFVLLAVSLASFYLSAQSAILSFVSLRFGFASALIALVVLQALALFLALAALAGQRSE